MLRKKLTPSVVRRCAIFLAMGGALGLNAGRVQGGLALDKASHDQSSLIVPDTFAGNSTGARSPDQTEATQGLASKANSVGQITNPAASVGTELTGEIWFQGLQDGVDHAFASPNNLNSNASTSQQDAINPLDNGVKANAIPSLPSFWSGLTCCLALMVAGMFPRVRRVFR